MKLHRIVLLVMVVALAVPLISATAVAQEVVTIEFWDNQQAESGLSQFQQAAVDLFEETHPGIKINVVTVPYAEYQDRLTIAVRGGTPPDISTVDQIWNYGFATGGAIIALDDYIAGSETVKQENFFPGAWNSAAFEGKVWGIPFNIDVWQFTFYNKALLDAAGVDENVDSAVALANFLEQSARQSAAEHMVHDIERLAPRVVAFEPAAAHHDVHLLGVVVQIRARARMLWRTARRSRATGSDTSKGRLDLRQHLDTIERSLVQQALERSGGTVAHAARLLGLRRTTLVEKLRKFGEPAGERGGDLTGPVACRASL